MKGLLTYRQQMAVIVLNLGPKISEIYTFTLQKDSYLQ